MSYAAVAVNLNIGKPAVKGHTLFIQTFNSLFLRNRSAAVRKFFGAPVYKHDYAVLAKGKKVFLYGYDSASRSDNRGFLLAFFFYGFGFAKPEILLAFLGDELFGRAARIVFHGFIGIREAFSGFLSKLFADSCLAAARHTHKHNVAHF